MWNMSLPVLTYVTFYWGWPVSKYAHHLLQNLLQFINICCNYYSQFNLIETKSISLLGLSQMFYKYTSIHNLIWVKPSRISNIMRSAGCKTEDVARWWVFSCMKLLKMYQTWSMVYVLNFQTNFCRYMCMYWVFSVSLTTLYLGKCQKAIK